MLRWIDLRHLSIFYEKRQKNKTVQRWHSSIIKLLAQSRLKQGEKKGGNEENVLQKHVTSYAKEESVVKKEGSFQRGKIESEETHKSTSGMFLLRLLSMGRAHSIKSRHV